MLVMVVFFIAFRWIHLSTPLIRLFLLVLILLLMPTLNFLPVWFALSLLRFRLPSRLPMMFILWMVAISRCVEACVYGTLDFVGYPRFPAPVEFIAAVIAYYVHPVNIQTACLIMEGAEFTENIIN